MLATLADEPPPVGGWLYEPKLDGVRVLIFASRGRVHLFSRNRKPLDAAYPELVEALSLAVRGDAVLDGEVVAIDPKRGISSFALLQQRMQLRDAVRAARSGVPVTLYLFDILHYEGIDLTGLPLVDRKAVLRDVVWYEDPIRFTPFRTSGSARMYRDACSRGAEGIIAKRAESRYVGTRSAEWLKIKCVLQQEFVIGGYTAPQGSREHLGALLVGYYDGKVLRYAGKVGTGYDSATLEMLYDRLQPLHRRTSPFAPGPIPVGTIQWVTPKLVAQIGYGEWTDAGLLRHPRYLGLRADKAAREVRREG
jgi:DNA ligase D-like protein (predicted ligase)